MIRTSKRKFVSKQLKDNKNAKKWWATVKKLTTNNQTSHSTNSTTVIEDKCLSDCDVAKNLNTYTSRALGEKQDKNPYLTHHRHILLYNTSV